MHLSGTRSTVTGRIKYHMYVVLPSFYLFSHCQSHEIEIVKIVKICCDPCNCQCSPLFLEAKIILSVKVTPLCQYVTNFIILGGE